MASGFVELEQCPLLAHRSEDWSKPWIGWVKPDQAGLRILALDGGGIKGVFFDLIVGTSAGGIIACGLGPGELSVEECATKFEALSTKAFSGSAVGKIPLIGKLVDEMLSVFNHGRYKTKPLEDAYKEAFPESQKLFGGTSGSATASVKVAVTTSTRHGRVIVLGNYNRKPPAQAFYDFQRPPPDREMFLWEAARATSAAPTYFAPFAHSGTSQVYLDGGLWHNNPIRIADAESRAIWPETKPRKADMMLSVGAGYHETESTLTEGAQKYQEQIKAETAVQDAATWRDNDDYVRFLVSVVLSQIKSSLSCERIWHEWLEARAPHQDQNRQRYRRLTVEFPRLVEMDDASKETMDVCHEAVKGMESAQFVDVADRLIASSFFFRFGTEDIVKLSDGRYEVSGSILCRLRLKSIALLGEHLDSSCKPSSSFRPYFIFRETHEDKGSRITIDGATIDAMKADGRFELPYEVRISTVLAETEMLLILRDERQRPADAPHISGFPRKLQEDYDGE
ncbi:hypothetical protein XA68_12791 [Ophiocordyceps unilateralis]|uniref:PNPLA domain-containing protein n=1 Tax=Ophiocordyceps unilateralis TaxID=268505 RepID=A0A2A9PC75_OPHUN|nr:hypothetical protein XA68_12791 [Ophiocordyceps unilateralis]